MKNFVVFRISVLFFLFSCSPNNSLNSQNSENILFRAFKKIELKLLNKELLKASYEGDIEKVKKLLDKGVDVNAKGKSILANIAVWLFEITTGEKNAKALLSLDETALMFAISQKNRDC